MVKLIKYFVIFLGIQIVALEFSVFANNIVNVSMFLINAFLSFIIIKRIEKRYYQKYRQLASALYNLCPLLGVSIFLLVLNYFWKEVFIHYLMNYYITLFIVIYIINLIYLLIWRVKRS